jgi:hypothetical protein
MSVNDFPKIENDLLTWYKLIWRIWPVPILVKIRLFFRCQDYLGDESGWLDDDWCLAIQSRCSNQQCRGVQSCLVSGPISCCSLHDLNEGLEFSLFNGLDRCHSSDFGMNHNRMCVCTLRRCLYRVTSLTHCPKKKEWMKPTLIQHNSSNASPYAVPSPFLCCSDYCLKVDYPLTMTFSLCIFYESKTIYYVICHWLGLSC